MSAPLSTSEADGRARESAHRLDIRGLTLEFQGLRALDEVELTLEAGRIGALIGPNGAGKSSLLNCISGLYRPTQGQLHYGDTPLHATAPHLIAEAGIGRVFQNIELFQKLSVMDNVLLGRHRAMRRGVLSNMLWFGATQREEKRHRADVAEILHLLRLDTIAGEPVAALAYGVAKRVELARALAMRPGLLLLDEPVAGMNEAEAAAMAAIVRRINGEFGISVLLVEHNMRFVMDLAHQVTVLNFGRVIASGDPAEVQRDTGVIAAYLGTSSSTTDRPS